MAAAIGVRSDYTSVDLRRFARRSGDADWTCFRKVESFPEVKGELDDEAKTVYEGI
jgi:hypothetical protein